ncbi:hypothetical protein I9W82_005684 [Candida metapsilosis]|uniref:Uncharacterized protein n=1 Tax=Candida metapsilosis TaxID=273372 RepID=A0A8H8D9D0_9ASCO|nr:hypothetical protein I9W82_005684 [Candida metapsilosis]
MTQVQLSPCRNYIGQIQPLEDSIELKIIQVPQNKLRRSFEVIDMIRSKFPTKDIPPALDISFQWEYNQKGRECEKLGVLIRNMAALFVLDINRDEASSVLIRQPQSEVIESFEWLPPIKEEKGTGYTNSTQVVLFSESNLSAKLYSLDCTRKLCTVHKPIKDRIIYRKTSSGSFWCLIADTFEYNVPPIMYQFLNTGSFSVLINSTRLRSFVSEEAHMDWSHSGNWLQLLDRNEDLSGYNLKVYGSNGVGGPHFAKPLVHIEFESEVEENGSIMESAGRVHTCWCSSSEEELLLSARVIGSYLELRVISMRLLKVVSRETKNLKEVAENITRGVTRVSHLNQLVFVQLDRHMLCVYKLDDSLGYITSIQTQMPILDIFVDESRWFIISEHQILLYENDVVKTLLSTDTVIYSASLLDKETIIVFNRGSNGESWDYLSTKASKANTSNQSMDEVTDTFAIRKRARFR